MMFDSQPRYSPDGSKIVFLSDRSGDENIWIAEPRRHRSAGRSQRARTRATGRRSGRRTANTSSCRARRGGPQGTQLWLYHVDGGSGVNLTGSEERRQLNPLGAAFGKDDRFVYYTERTAAGSVYNQMTFRWQLGVYDRQTGEHFRMSDELGSAMRPVLSPDGRWLVYATRWDAQTGLRVRDLKSGDDSWLIYPVTRDDQESALDARPDARFVVHAGFESTDHVVRRQHLARRGAVRRSDADPVHREGRAEARTEGPVRLPARRRARARAADPLSAALARRQKLAFTALDRLWVMDYPGGKPRRVSTSDAGEHQPSWSPDGRFITYVTWSDLEGGHVYRVAGRRRHPAEADRKSRRSIQIRSTHPTVSASSSFAGRAVSGRRTSRRRAAAARQWSSCGFRPAAARPR